jgi:hypothetical protein
MNGNHVTKQSTLNAETNEEADHAQSNKADYVECESSLTPPRVLKPYEEFWLPKMPKNEPFEPASMQLVFNMKCHAQTQSALINFIHVKGDLTMRLLENLAREGHFCLANLMATCQNLFKVIIAFPVRHLFFVWLKLHCTPADSVADKHRHHDEGLLRGCQLRSSPYSG